MLHGNTIRAAARKIYEDGAAQFFGHQENAVACAGAVEDLAWEFGEIATVRIETLDVGFAVRMIETGEA